MRRPEGEDRLHLTVFFEVIAVRKVSSISRRAHPRKPQPSVALGATAVGPLDPSAGYMPLHVRCTDRSSSLGRADASVGS